jgi:hypothetical protein
MCGSGIVRITPALVPIQSRSLHARSDVTRRHAALCCRIMSSQPEHVQHTRSLVYRIIRENLKKYNLKLHHAPVLWKGCSWKYICTGETPLTSMLQVEMLSYRNFSVLCCNTKTYFYPLDGNSITATNIPLHHRCMHMDSLVASYISCYITDASEYVICSACYLIQAGFLLSLFFDPKHGGDMFLRNIS